VSLRRRFSPPYSIVVVSDQGDIDLPEALQGRVVSASESAVLVACLSEADGETQFTLGRIADLDRREAPAYHGTLRTPNHLLAVWSAEGQQLLALAVSHETTNVKIWTNHPTEPDDIVVAVEE
jgi:hypothetical protein